MPSVIATALPVVHDQRGRIAIDERLRSRSHTNVWALGDCASIPGPDGRPYPAVAQHGIVLDWTVAVFFRPDITKSELRVERDQATIRTPGRLRA